MAMEALAETTWEEHEVWSREGEIIAEIQSPAEMRFCHVIPGSKFSCRAHCHDSPLWSRSQVHRTRQSISTATRARGASVSNVVSQRAQEGAVSPTSFLDSLQGAENLYSIDEVPL